MKGQINIPDPNTKSITNKEKCNMEIMFYLETNETTESLELSERQGHLRLVIVILVHLWLLLM